KMLSRTGKQTTHEHRGGCQLVDPCCGRVSSSAIRSNDARWRPSRAAVLDTVDRGGVTVAELKPAGERPPRKASSITRVGMDPSVFKRSVLDHVLYTCAREPRHASAADFYQALAHTVRDRLVHRWLATQRTYQERDVKRVHYLSSEFLTGRSLGLCLLHPGLYQTAEPLAAEPRLDLGETLDAEGDPGLGNGGLGRLAACFMDSLATLALPAVGYGIRYDCGSFEQRLEGGQQIELHDNWLRRG